MYHRAGGRGRKFLIRKESEDLSSRKSYDHFQLLRARTCILIKREVRAYREFLILCSTEFYIIRDV